MKAVVSTAANLIDSKLHQQLSEQYKTRNEITESESDERYNTIHQLLRMIHEANDLETDMYTMILDSASQKYEFIVTSSPKPYFRHSYTLYPKELSEKIDAVTTFDLYESENGRWLSAAAPIVNLEGKTVALVQADTRFDSFIAEARDALIRRLAITVALILPVIMLFSFYLRRLTLQNIIIQRNLLSKIATIERQKKTIEDINESLIQSNKRIEAQRNTIRERSIHLKDANEKVKQKNAELLSTLTRLRRTQKQLIESEKLVSIGILSGGIAHEINNPLNYIQGGVSCIKQIIETSIIGKEEEVRKFLEAIEVGVGRASGVISKLSEITNKRARSNVEAIGASEVIADALQSLNHYHSSGNSHIIVDSGKDFIVKGNKYELVNSLIQLIKNANDAVYRLENRKIQIYCHQSNGGNSITIDDNGTGIEPLSLGNIFDPFYTTKDPGKGEGLGLFYAKTILGKHGGVLEAKSVIGKGTKMTVTFPNGEL